MSPLKPVAMLFTDKDSAFSAIDLLGAHPRPAEVSCHSSVRNLAEIWVAPSSRTSYSSSQTQSALSRILLPLSCLPLLTRLITADSACRSGKRKSWVALITTSAMQANCSIDFRILPILFLLILV